MNNPTPKEMTVFMPDEAVSHRDGTWTIPTSDGDWRIFPIDGGWAAHLGPADAVQPDGWDVLWARPVDAANAILGNRRYGQQ